MDVATGGVAVRLHGDFAVTAVIRPVLPLVRKLVAQHPLSPSSGSTPSLRGVVRSTLSSEVGIQTLCKHLKPDFSIRHNTTVTLQLHILRRRFFWIDHPVAQRIYPSIVRQKTWKEADHGHTLEILTSIKTHKTLAESRAFAQAWILI